MKVLFVALTFVPDRRSANPGVNRYWCELSKALTIRGVDIQVLTPLRAGLPKTETWGAINVLRIPDSKTFIGRTGVIGDISALSFSLNLRRHRDLVESVDLIQTDMPVLALLRAQGTPPCVSIVHHPYRVWTGLDLLWVPFAVRYQRRSLERSDRIVVPSQAVAEELAESQGIDLTSITAVHHGIDTQMFAPAEASQKVGDDKRARVAYVGLLEKRKGISDLVDAIARLSAGGRDATLTLVSGGSDSTALKQYCQERRLLERVEFVENADDEDLVRILRGCDVFAFPSHQEGFGFAMVEAMACGKPVVAYDTATAREILGECGVLVPRWDPDAFCDALFELLADRERMQQIGNSARARVVRRFGWDRAASNYLAVYNNLLQ